MAIDVQQKLLSIGEQAAISAVKEIARPLAIEYIQNSPTPIDDILLPFIDQLEEFILQYLDQIDGEDDV